MAESEREVASHRELALVTGANGFIGSALVSRLCSDGVSVRAAVRQARSPTPECEHEVVGEIDGSTDWANALAGVDVVVHCAAQVGAIAGDPDSLDELRETNVDGTRTLACQAAEHGVQRFVFISSVKVNGERTEPGARFYADDEPSPEDAYGVSKFEAEQALREIGVETGMEVVIIRPPLVYGPGVRGNFASMMRWVKKGVPLPLGAVNNRRSLVALDNLVDLVTICIDHPAAANEVFLVSDGEDLSTTDLLRRVGNAMDRPARLMPVPPCLLEAAAAILGKRDVARRLLGSLQVDISKTWDLLGWEPPILVDEGLRRAVGSHIVRMSGFSRDE